MDWFYNAVAELEEYLERIEEEDDPRHYWRVVDMIEELQEAYASLIDALSDAVVFLEKVQ